MLSIIAAIAPGGVIGRGNYIPWHIEEDLKLFKSITMGKTVIMGRNTFESIGSTLPGRKNIVLSSTLPAGRHPGEPEFTVFGCLDAALSFTGTGGNAEIFIIGGGRLYAEALPRTGRMYLSMIKGSYSGDVFFPEYNQDEWKLTRETEYTEFTLQILERQK